MRPFIDYILNQGIIDDSNLTFVDVGCSGGINTELLKFGRHLRAFGFDPVINEVRSLNNRIYSFLDVNYIPCFVGTPSPACANIDSGDAPAKFRLATYPEGIQAPFGGSLGTSNSQTSDKRVALDDYFADLAGSIDFIKTDTDGYDLDVLQSGQKILLDKRVLGLQVEVMFHGSLAPSANTFSNVDIWLRENGFSLFDLDLNRTARRALPSKAVKHIICYSEKGQLNYANAYYFRDFGDINYEQRCNFIPSALECIKLACFFEMYDLQDCAAELLIERRSLIGELIDIDHSLDLLTTSLYGELESYKEHMRLFNESSTYFYPELKSELDKLGVNYKEYNEIVVGMHKMHLSLSDYDCSGKSVVFYGAGSRLESMLPYLQSWLEEAKNIAVCDTSPHKQGTDFMGYKVLSPEAMVRTKPDLVLISSVFAKEILIYLRKLQKELGVDFKIALLD